MARLNTDAIVYSGFTYQAQPVVSASSKTSEKPNKDTILELRNQNNILTEMLGILMSERTMVVENAISLDGRAVAKGTAKYINDEISCMSKRNNRLAGVY